MTFLSHIIKVCAYFKVVTPVCKCNLILCALSLYFPITITVTITITILSSD